LLSLCFKGIQLSGLRLTDPRLASLMKRIERLTPSSITFEQLNLDAQLLKGIINEHFHVKNMNATSKSPTKRKKAIFKERIYK